MINWLRRINNNCSLKIFHSKYYAIFSYKAWCYFMQYKHSNKDNGNCGFFFRVLPLESEAELISLDSIQKYISQA